MSGRRATRDVNSYLTATSRNDVLQQFVVEGDLRRDVERQSLEDFAADSLLALEHVGQLRAELRLAHRIFEREVFLRWRR